MDRRAAGVLALLVLGGLAGCGALPEQADALTGPESHPFAGETVTVAVDGTARERALVADGLDYWEQHAGEYAGFDVEFRLLGPRSTAKPDVRLEFVQTVSDCGDTEFSAGCAPRVNASTGVDRPATVEIRRGLADESTQLVVRHEVGHLLGLTHADSPRELMTHEQALATLPRTNASERPNPWSKSELTVAMAGGSDDRYRTELAYGLAYLSEGADGAVPANVSLRVVEDADAADIVVRPVPAADCTVGSGACIRVGGTDPDQDGTIETYTSAEIRLVGLDADVASWYVAAQLVGTFNTGDGPDRLYESDARERAGDWYG